MHDCHEPAFSQPPPLSSRPPVTGYVVSHNTTGSVLTNLTHETKFTLEGVRVGVYSFTVQAFNILGVGATEAVSVTATGRSYYT